MKSSNIQAPHSNWFRVFRSYGVFLTLELGLTIIFVFALKLTADQVVGPYFAFAVPPAIYLVINQFLLIAERHGVSRKKLALGWGLCAGMFASGSMLALFFTGEKFDLINPRDMGAIIFAAVMTVVSFSVSGYVLTLSRNISKAGEGNSGD